ncbi:hypothetical protein MYA98_12285 [Salmonella sp. WGH-01]|nr:hypothetical protein MYA98_12285 [Salmonella sp. WGH-01]
MDQLGGAVDSARATATPVVLSGLRWQGKLSGLLDMISARQASPRVWITGQFCFHSRRRVLSSSHF